LKHLNKLFTLLLVSIMTLSLSGCLADGGKAHTPEVSTPTPEVEEQVAEPTFRLSWMEKTEDELNSMSDEELISLYIDLRLFEQEYRSILYDTIQSGRRFYITASYLVNSSARIDYNGNIDALIVNADSHDRLMQYFDAKSNSDYTRDYLLDLGYSSYSDYLSNLANNLPTEGYSKDDIKSYILNFGVDDEGYPFFRDQNMIVDKTYLNEQIFLFSSVENFYFKTDAYNDNFVGGR